MSSLSQEDLDAGWDDEPGQSVATKAKTADTVSQSIPPNSITIEKSPAPLESVIVRSAPDNAEVADSNVSGTDPLSPPDITVTESNDVNAPVGEERARAPAEQVAVDPLPSESDSGPTAPRTAAEPMAQAVSASPAPVVQSNLEQLAQPTESSSEPMAQTAESSLEQSAQPVESSSEPMAQTAESSLEPSEPPASGSVPIAHSASPDLPLALDFDAQGISTAAEGAPEPEVAKASATGALAAELPNSQLELFTAVAEKPQLLAQKGVNTGAEAEPAALESATEAVEVPVESKAPSALSGRDVPATQGTPIIRESSVRSRESAELGVDEPVAVEVAPKSETESYPIKHWRTIAIAAAAALFLVVGLLAIRSKHARTGRDQPIVQSKIGDIQSQHVAPPLVSGAASSAGESAALAKSATPTEIGAPEPVRPAPATGAQSESFSDAFLKHAATANSSWADVKKRPRAIESSQLTKPSAASNAKGNDDPLDVLDKLEKARRAKKSTAK